MMPHTLIWRLITYRPTLYVAAAVAWNFFLTMALAPGLIVREILNVLTGRAQFDLGLGMLLILFVAITLVRLAVTYGAVAADVTFQYVAGALLRKNLFIRILAQPGASALSVSPGDAISRFRDDVDQVILLSSNAPYVISQLLFTSLAVFIMAQINWAITLCVVVPVLCVVTIVHRSSKLIEKYRRAGRAANGSVTEYLSELFGMILTIKVTSVESSAVARFRRLNEDRRQAMLKDRLFSELVTSLSANTVNIGTGLMLLLVGQAIRTGAFTVGDFSLFVYYLYYVTGLPIWLGKFLAQYKQTAVSIERLLGLARDESGLSLVAHGPVYEHGDVPAVPAPLRTEDDQLRTLEVRNLTFQHPSGRGIKDINLILKRGSCTVITGRIGSGKTTVLRCILGLLPATSGSIYWNGEHVAVPASFFVPPRSAYTPQAPRLFTDTIKDNMLMGIPLNMADFEQAIHLAALEQDLLAMEQEVETKVGPKGARLSGGQLQRVAAARMFARTPELIVVDDVSSALDVKTEQILWDRLFQQRDKTCLIVSHRHAALRRANHIVVLREGRIHAEGTLEQLLTTNSEMQQIWRGQTEVN